jgi:gamma-glutamyltranspeptidase/glutathione hydrolase/leukotriene-C4 hydrolase
MKRVTAISTAVLLIFIIGLGVFLWVAYRFGLQPDDDGNNDITNTSELVTTPSTTVNSLLSTGAVATTSDECTDATIGILRRGGSAVDAAICATLCQGVTVPQASGIGGGFLATIYIKETNTVVTLNAREVAPLRAHRDMYNDSSTSSSEGGLSIAVPTEVKGLWELHKRYGKLSWAEVIEPVIEVADMGFKVNNYLATVLMSREDKIRSIKGFR